MSGIFKGRRMIHAACVAAGCPCKVVSCFSRFALRAEFGTSIIMLAQENGSVDGAKPLNAGCEQRNGLSEEICAGCEERNDWREAICGCCEGYDPTQGMSTEHRLLAAQTPTWATLQWDSSAMLKGVSSQTICVGCKERNGPSEAICTVGEKRKGLRGAICAGCEKSNGLPEAIWTGCEKRNGLREAMVQRL